MLFGYFVNVGMDVSWDAEMSVSEMRINYKLFDRGDQCVDSFHHQKFLFDLPLIRQLFPLTKTFTRNPYFEGGGTHKYFPKWPFSISKKSCL